MLSLREILAHQGPMSFRAVAARYPVSSFRDLHRMEHSLSSFNYLGYSFERTDSSISIQNHAGEKTEIKLDSTPLTPDERKSVLDKSWDDIKKFLKDNWEKIEDGSIKAVDIGGALFGSVATAIAIVKAPFGDGFVSKVLITPFVTLATNRGRYFGAAVDELIALLKNESDLTKRDVIGVLASVGIVMTYFAPFGGLIPLGGTTAWGLTVSVGKWVGGALEEGLEEIKKIPVVGDVVSVGEDMVEGVEDFLDDIF